MNRESSKPIGRATSKVLKQLESKDTEAAYRLRSLLESAQTQVKPPCGSILLAGDLEPIYRVRNQMAREDKRERKFIGLSSFVSELQTSLPSRQIEVLSVVGDTEQGDIFLDAVTKDVIGAVVITMSAHTRAYFRGELTGDPTGTTQAFRKPAKSSAQRVAKTKPVMA